MFFPEAKQLPTQVRREATEARRDDATLDDNSVVGSRLVQVGPPHDPRQRDDRDKGLDRE